MTKRKRLPAVEPEFLTDSPIRLVYDSEFTRLLVRGQIVFKLIIAAMRERNAERARFRSQSDKRSDGAIPERFAWKGWEILLSGGRARGGAWIWTAEIHGTDYTFLAPGKPGDDVERVKHLVRDWIDDGFPRGGAAH